MPPPVKGHKPPLTIYLMLLAGNKLCASGRKPSQCFLDIQTLIVVAHRGLLCISKNMAEGSAREF